MTKDESFVRKELEKVYPQLLINMKKICGHGSDLWADDLLPVAITFFLEKPIKQQLKTINEGKLENFITFIANMQLKSKSSYYYTRYRKPNLVMREMFANIDYAEVDQVNDQEVFDCVNNALMGVGEKYRSLIINVVFGGMTIIDVAKELNVTQHTARNILNEQTKLIQNKCIHLTL